MPSFDELNALKSQILSSRFAQEETAAHNMQIADEPRPTISNNELKMLEVRSAVQYAVSMSDLDTAIRIIHGALETDPDNGVVTSLLSDIDMLRRKNGLPYMFPGGLGEAVTIDDIYGLLTKGDLNALRFAAVRSKGISVNIGVFNGLSSYVIAKANPQLQVLGIDAFLGMTAQNLEINYEQQKIADRNLSLTGNARLLVGLSEEIAKNWNDKIGFLFIDGNHQVAGAVSDFNAWAPFVEEGGFIAVHDAYSMVSNSVMHMRERHNSHGPDVICTMMANDPQYEFVLSDGSTQIFRKRISDHGLLHGCGSRQNDEETVKAPLSAGDKKMRRASYCNETCIVFVSYGRPEISSRSYQSLTAALEPYRDRIKIIISDASNDIKKLEWACSTKADDIIYTPRPTSAATSRNLATTLAIDKYSPEFLCMLEDDFEYQPEWYPSLVRTTKNLYGVVSPFGLAYGIFSACDHHIPQERRIDDHENEVSAYLFGAVAYQRFMPTSHYLGVMRGWDPDLLGISYAQTGGQTFRNLMRGFCGAIVPGNLSRPIDGESVASTWSHGKRNPGPPAHSFVMQDYDVIRSAAEKMGSYLRDANEK